MIQGDLIGAASVLRESAPRTEALGFPQGPYSAAFERFVEVWICIEAGLLDRAAISSPS